MLRLVLFLKKEKNRELTRHPDKTTHFKYQSLQKTHTSLPNTYQRIRSAQFAKICLFQRRDPETSNFPLSKTDFHKTTRS